MRRLVTLALVGVFAWATVGASSCGSTSSSDSSGDSGGGSSGTPAARQHPNMTAGEANALQSARDYLDSGSFSKKGLIEQLSSSAGEGFSRHDAKFAVDHLHVNWYAQAAKSAADYLQSSPMSKADLIEQLSSSVGEGFTEAQAEYGADKAYK